MVNVKAPLNAKHDPKGSNQDHIHDANLVILVVSNAKNQDLRRAQREAFNQSFLKSLGMKRFFLLFTDDGNIAQKSIEDENKRHLDIIQGSMQENYKNLAFKHLMGLHWAGQHCKNYR